MQVIEPENVDFEAVKMMLRRLCDPSVVGAVCGRARLRDSLSRQLGCPAPLVDQALDTMIARGQLRQQVHPDGWVYWAVR